MRRLLDDLQVRVDVRPSDFEKIPRSGAVVAVSNHPFGILDGVMLADLLTRARPDVRILTNQLLGELPELARICFFIDPFDRPGKPRSQRARVETSHSGTCARVGCC